jgi:hypothetical protein
MQQSAPPNAQPVRGTWTEERPLSSPRVEVAVAAVGRAPLAVTATVWWPRPGMKHTIQGSTHGAYWLLFRKRGTTLRSPKSEASFSRLAASRRLWIKALPPIPSSIAAVGRASGDGLPPNGG